MCCLSSDIVSPLLLDSLVVTRGGARCSGDVLSEADGRGETPAKVFGHESVDEWIQTTKKLKIQISF